MTKNALHTLTGQFESPRAFEQLAIKLFEMLPGAMVTRTRDVIQLEHGGERGIVILMTPEAVELRLPTVCWTGPHSPVPSSELWQRIDDVRTLKPRDWRRLIAAARAQRAAVFVACRYCGEEFPPEHRHGDMCHGCAERHHGVVH